MPSNYFNPSRRTVLKGIVGLGTSLVFSGCIPCRTCGIDTAGTLPTSLDQPNSLITFAVFDAHSHVFNARDLQVAGYLRGPVANDSDPFTADLLCSIADELQVFGYYWAPSVQDEAASLKQPERIVPSGEPGSRYIKEEDQARELLLDFLNKSKFKEKLRETARKHRITPSAAALGDLYSREELDDILDRKLRGRAFDKEAGDGFIAFLKHTLSYRYHNVRTMWDTYAANPTIRPDAFFTALVDFDYWLEEGVHRGTPSCLRDQVLLTEALCVRYGGAILPLVPFNPWTEVMKSGESLKLVREAVEQHGFVGVKIYPTVGYAPYGNREVASHPPDVWNKLGPNPEEIGQLLDESMLGLLKWCAENDVPVVGHANHSRGAGLDTLKLTGPNYWAKALDVAHKATNKPLRVSLGHFGGETTDYCSPHQAFCWQNAFIDEMKKPTGRWMYADIAYWNEFLTGGNEALKFLSGQAATGMPLNRHLIYGSDWFMLVMENRNELYVERVYGWTQSIDYALAKKIFQDNVADLFGLRALDETGRKPKTRERLEKFYMARGISKPAWMSKLDSNSPA